MFLLALGAVARITRFVNADVLGGPLRAAVIRRFGPDSTPVEFVGCPWCVSVWVAAPVAVLAWLFGHTAGFVVPAAWLSLSYLYSIAAAWLDEE